jgi:Domain of unknown function (DUF6895)
VQQDLLEARPLPPAARPLDPLARGALQWLVVNVDRFSPLGGGNEREDAEKHKAFIELAVLVWRLGREPALADNRELGRLLQFIAAVFAIEPFRERLIRVDDLFVVYALIYAVLQEAGLVDDPNELHRMQRFVDNSTVQVSERSPHRMLEVRQVLDAAGLRHSLPSFDVLASRTILGQPISLVRATEHDAYSITHDVFYLSDWGCAPVRGLSDATLRRTASTVDELLGMYIYARHWDLVGELLLAVRFLGHTSSDFYRSGRRALHDAQLTGGVVPGPAYDAAEADALEEDARRDYAFKECYHPTLVAALVGALCDD